jgi:hypothetical protein
MPGNPSKVLVTSNDSRIRVYDELEMVSKYKGVPHSQLLRRVIVD